MSITDFFSSLNLDIKLTDEFFPETFADMFSHFKHPYHITMKDVIDTISLRSVWHR